METYRKRSCLSEEKREKIYQSLKNKFPELLVVVIQNLKQTVQRVLGGGASIYIIIVTQ